MTLKPAEALRYQEGKPQLDYLFTYEGGVEAALCVDHPYFGTLKALAVLYRHPAQCGLRDAVNDVIDALHADALDAGRTLAFDIADTCQRGAAKYAVGNYLKGGSWRQYYRGALSHALALARGEEVDAEGFSHHGNFDWNVLMACHSATTGLGTDDRIRAPK